MYKDKIKLVILIFCTVYAITSTGCKKYLDAKNDISVDEPKSLIAMQAIMDYVYWVNYLQAGEGGLASDEYYLPESKFNSLSEDEYRNMYKWANEDVVPSASANGWTNSYDNVYRANTVLEGLTKLDPTINSTVYNNVKGQALFLRARSFFEVAAIWAEAYDSQGAGGKLGIPLRLTSDFNVPSVRSSLKDTYSRIVSDLKNSIALLPNYAVHVVRGSKVAAYGELGRVYLSMRMYDSCLLYTEMALNLYDTLMDYNELDTAKPYPFARFGPEVIFHSQIGGGFNSYAYVDSNIYNSFDINDLRKVVFFNANSDGSHSFGGSYVGANGLFSGIATDELVLMKAECLVRNGEIALGLSDLNRLLTLRYKTGTFKNLITVDQDVALKWILEERKKELLFRSLRWIDIKRLNKEGANISLNRTVGTKTYILPANDLRFALAIPKDIIEISGMKQNPR